MDPPTAHGLDSRRRGSFASQDSHTAKEFIDEQTRLEADAREILPYSFDSCTYDLGPLRQTLFSCLTCNPPPTNPDDPYTPAAICYSCSIACHGEHTLVELFQKRNFVCDCGTTRLPSTSPCTLRADPKTGRKGVHSQEAAATNTYNHNFRDKFCGCAEAYDPYSEKGTMFQCLGLGSVETGGCGEDWWHPECLIGISKDWQEGIPKKDDVPATTSADDLDSDVPLPSGFPAMDDWAVLVCYKCVESNPWIKRYAGTPGFFPPVYKNGGMKDDAPAEAQALVQVPEPSKGEAGKSKKRKAEDDEPIQSESSTKRVKEESNVSSLATIEEKPEPETSTLVPIEEKSSTIAPEEQPEPEISTRTPLKEELSTTATGESATEEKATEEKKESSELKPKHTTLPTDIPTAPFSLFCKEDFYDKFCRCAECFPNLSPYPQLREEEEAYEPPISEDGDAAGSISGTNSLLERGEAALSTVDRVRAIEGAMVYNNLRDKVKMFLKPYAESGKAVSAEDVKAYFEKLRGDEQGIRDAAGQAETGRDNRREQSGY